MSRQTKVTGETKQQFVHEVFESIAKDYDRMNTLLSFRRHKAWRTQAMKKMAVQPGDTAIDVCCGTCDWSLSLAEASGTGNVVGLDFSRNMLHVGEQKVKAAGKTAQVELIHGNAMELPFPDHTFDHATIGFALRNVPDYRHVIREMARVVKPGGQVVSLELSKPTWPPFRAVYYFYFQRILPRLGKLFADRYEQYRWLPESLVTFPDYKELARIMKEEGCFDRVDVKPLTGGIAALHIGRVKGGA
ncbi:demethylmenaquinone methyltransferase [Desmospora profundinema]|uniref:Demethylmenaquinone methyltransferase n=1 Tax=Desmospora profundinema TaxID=1571184 RepID=A0ABU1IIA1_9BACL|nr:demethylmenaquinone methyltransferase [Desmospora profundinema]MDR6224505.1 demethylmenaquinone methyltransferase/2-methoxy-6-polyprenyl-1,4-benzoquinol methylase [Desmospora profundinema]